MQPLPFSGYYFHIASVHGRRSVPIYVFFRLFILIMQVSPLVPLLVCASVGTLSLCVCVFVCVCVYVCVFHQFAVCPSGEVR